MKLDAFPAYVERLDLLADILGDHDRGAHEPPACRYSDGRVVACSGVLCRVEWDDGTLWHLCDAHARRSQAQGLLRAKARVWLPPPQCTVCPPGPHDVP